MDLDSVVCLVLGKKQKIPEGWFQEFADWRVAEHDSCYCKMENIFSKCANSYLKYLEVTCFTSHWHAKSNQSFKVEEKQSGQWNMQSWCFSLHVIGVEGNWSKQSTAAHCTVVNHADTFSWTVTCMTKLFTMVRELCLRWSLLRADRQSGHTWQLWATSCFLFEAAAKWTLRTLKCACGISMDIGNYVEDIFQVSAWSGLLLVVLTTTIGRSIQPGKIRKTTLRW